MHRPKCLQRRRWPVWLWAGLAVLGCIGACTEHDPELDRVGGPLPDLDASVLPESAADVATDSEAGACVLPDAGTPAAHIPCDVDAILAAKCRRCHTDPTQNGAPFPLIEWSKLFAPYGAVVVYQAMFKAVDSDFMPLCAEGTCGTFDPPVAALSAEEKSALLAWLSCPLPEVGGACSD